MKRLTAAALLWVSLIAPALAQGGMGPGPGTVHTTGGGGYTGPLDIITTNNVDCWSFRACSAAVASPGTNVAVNVENSAQTITCDLLITTAGALGNTTGCSDSGASNGKTATAFAGTDTSGTGTITGRTLTFAGGTIYDVVTCATCAPGTIIISGLSGSWGVNISQTVLSSTITLTKPLYAVKWYGQINGNTCTFEAATSQFFAPVGPNSVPGLYAPYAQSSHSYCATAATFTLANTTPFTMSSIARRDTVLQSINYADMISIYGGGSSQAGLLFLNTSNTSQFSLPGAGSTNVTVTDDTYHTFIGTQTNATTGAFLADETSSAVTPGSGSQTAVISLMGSTTTAQYLDGWESEAVLWNGTAASGTPLTNLQANMKAWAGTP